MALSIRHVADQLFVEVRLVKEQHGQLTDELLSALHFVFHQPLLHALDLVDQKKVTKLTSTSGRVLYQVEGSSNRVYNCLITGEFCTCPSYTYTVLVKTESLMCKHLLAVHLAEALGECTNKAIRDEEFAAFMCCDRVADAKGDEDPTASGQ
ncbi:zinc finger SWIM domain-containing protein 7-like [Montipora capricornis]|uniref:zinc finger SWIM domain-containing protein 7-like n=1 Tax=Montipora capricornis TaxID=246305 RepID=UPI0035F1E033